MLEVEGGEDVQAKTPALGENGIPDGTGIADGIHIAVALPEAVDGVQLLPGRGAILLQRILHKLIVYRLAHPLSHIDGGGGLIPDQVVLLLGLVVVKGVGHHIPEGHAPAAAVRVGEHHAGLHDDPVFGAQIAVLVLNILRPLLHSLVRAPARAVLCLGQPAQQVQEGVVGFVDFIDVAGSDGLSLCAPHRGIVAIEPAGRPIIRIEVEHLLLLLIRDAGLRLELIGGGHPPLVVALGGVIGIDAVLYRGACHQLGGVGPGGVILQGVGVVPGDVAAALLRRPAVPPHYIQGRAYHVPSVPVLGIQVGDNTARKFNQSKAQKGPFRVDGPGHIGGAGLPATGAAGVVGPHISGRGGIGGGGPVGARGRVLGCEHPQRNAGIGAISCGDVVGQLVGGDPIVRRFNFCPFAVLLVSCPVQAVCLQAGGAPRSPADGHNLVHHAEQQGLAARHGLCLELGQALRLPVGAGNDILEPGQPGIKLCFRVLPDIGDAGDQVGQVDQDAVFVHPAGALQRVPCPAALTIADLQAGVPILQQGKGLPGWNGRRLCGPGLCGIDSQGIVSAVPGGSPGGIQFKAAGGGIIGRCAGGKCPGRQDAECHNKSQE